MGEIAKESGEQWVCIEEIYKALSQINNVVLQNSSISEQTASISNELVSLERDSDAKVYSQILNQVRIENRTIVLIDHSYN